MIIKCISLWQPWAWAMWNLFKEYETRDSHAPVVGGLRSYSGPIGIHAALMPMESAVKKTLFGDEFREFHASEIEKECREWWNEFTKHCGMERPSKRDYGVLGGICKRGDIFRTENIKDTLSEREQFLGGYADGRRAIHCPGMVKLLKPIPMKGHQGLWDWEAPKEIESGAPTLRHVFR